MPKSLYDLSTGFDNNSLLNLKIDTFERMNKLQESLNIPDYESIPIPEYKPFIPKDLDTDTILKGDQKLPSLKEALNSANPNIEKAARKALEMQAAKNPVFYGVGTTQVVPYTEGQDKFTDNSWLKGRRNTMYGYNPYVSMEENEDFMNQNVWNSYTNFGKAWRGVGLFTGRALSKAVTGLVGLVGDIGAIAWNGLQELGDTMNINDGTKNNFWYDVSNNWLSRKMEEADNHVKQQWLPTYKAMNYDNKGAWEKLMDPYTWTNSFADGAGFLLQFAVPGAMLGKVGQAGRLARSIGALEAELVTAEAAGDVAKVAKLTKTIAQAKNVNAFTRAMGYDISNKYGAGIARRLTGSDNVGGISAHVFNTMMESVAETKEGFNSTVEELMRKGISKDKAIEIAGENAPGQFWINTAILTASNAFENKLLQKAVGNRRLSLIDELDNGTLPKNLAEPTTKLGKFFENNAWGNRIKFYGTNATKSSFWEGFWEENAQTAAARWARGEYDRKGDDGGATEEAKNTFIGQLWKQTKDAIKGNDREAADSIMAGAVIGILGNTVFSKLASTRGEIYDTDGKTILKPKTFLPEGQRKAELREKAQKVATFINTRDAWLSINTFGADIYNEDGSVNQEKASKKTEEIKQKLAKINSVFSESLKSEDLLDDMSKNLLETKVFTEYVKAHIFNETGDALVERLENWNSKSPEELSIYGVSSETKEGATKWANKARSLVEAYNKYKEIKYAAPADTLLNEYQNITNAIRSILLDYTGFKNIAEELSSKYSSLMEANNPFSDHPELQDYNQNQIKLIKLRQKLENEDLDVLQKEAIQKQIENIEKEQKTKKETFATLNETQESKEGLVFPKNINQSKEAEKIANYQDFFANLSNKIDSDIEIEKLDQLIKEYSDPKTGYSKYVNGVDYFDKVYNKPADEKVASDTKEEIKKTKEELKKEVEELKADIENKKTKEERDAQLEKIKEKEQEISKQEEEIEATETVVKEEDISDIPDLPVEKQYGTDEYVEQALAYVTPFKTVNKESIDAKDKEGNRLWWKEIVLEHSYDHDLTNFAKFFQHEIVKFPDKYELFVIKDTIELMKQRLSKTQLENFDEGNFKEGAIVVFREKGKQEWLKFKNGKTIAFSYNQEAFNYNFDERVRINSERTNRSVSEVIEFFKKQQSILEAVRETVITKDVQIPIKSISGSLGVYPTTKAGNAFERFGDFIDNTEPIVIIKSDNKNQVKDALEGQVYLNIPEGKTVNGKTAYIPVYVSTIQKGEPTSLQEKIYNSIQAIQLTTFKTKKEASDIIKNYLYNFFYVNETNNFKIKETQSGFKIIYQDKKGEHSNWLNIPRLKISDKLYNTEEGFSLYEKKDNVFQPIAKITKEEYRKFINNHLLTNRKVLIQNIKNVGYKVYTEPVNAYLNLSVINEEDVMAGVSTKTTKNAVLLPNTSLQDQVAGTTRTEIINTSTESSNIEAKKADIKRRRQEELKASKLNNSLSEFEVEDTPDLKSGSNSKRLKIKKDGEEIGIVSLNIDENGNVRIAYMEINPSNRRKGLAEKFYKDLNKALQKNKQGVLHSDKVFLDELTEWERMKKRGELRKWILDGKELSKDEIDALKKDIDKVIKLQDSGRLVTEEAEDLLEVLPAQKMWEKLVEKGFAEKLEDGTYRFKYDAELADLEKNKLNEPVVVNRNTEILKEIAILEDRIKTSNNFINNTDSNDAIRRAEKEIKEYEKDIKKLKGELLALEQAKPEDDALLTLIKKHIKGDPSNSIVHRQPIQYFIDKAGESPLKAIKEFGGEDIVKELLSRLPIEKLQENYEFLAKLDPTSDEALALDEIITKFKKTGKIILPSKSSEQVVNPKVDLSPDQELKIRLEELKESLKTAGPIVAKAIQANINQLEKQLKEIEKPKENLSPLEKLRVIANEGTVQTQIPSIVPHIFEGNPFKIDFENDTIDGYFEDSGKEYSQDFFNSFNPAIYKKSMLKNNGLNFYFVKHKVLDKFVVFDENMRTYKKSELPKAILESSEFKNIENCN